MKIVRNIKVVLIPCDAGMTHGLMPYLYRTRAFKKALDTGQLACIVVDEADPRRTAVQGICRTNVSTAFVMITAKEKRKGRKEEFAHTLDRMISAIEKYTEEDI